MDHRTAPSTSRADVWVVEDSEDYRSAVVEILSGADELRCTGAFSSAEEALDRLAQTFAPEVVLMDIGLPGLTGIEALPRLKRTSPVTDVVMLTVHDDNDRLFTALCAGASGYLLKSCTPEELLRAVREVLRGGSAMTPQIARRVLNLFNQLHSPRGDYGLTPREVEVLSELTTGRTKTEIAERLYLSFHTVDTHLRNIYAKLHVHSRSGAVAKALNERLLSRPEQV